MAVSKRVRYEVLKRDEHTCRYCGAKAPEVVLHVDHVIPKALGGSDKPDNLVAACKDCNLGKTSTTANDSIAAEVNEAALAYAAALRRNLETITGAALNLRSARIELEAHWEQLADTYGYSYPPLMDDNWGSTLSRWLSVGLTVDFLKDAMEIAYAKYGVSRPDRFRYFCGVVYRTLDKAHEQTRTAPRTVETRKDADGVEYTPCGHCSSCRDGEPEDCSVLSGGGCDVCDSDGEISYCVWASAFSEGAISEHMRNWYAQQDEYDKGCGHCASCAHPEWEAPCELRCVPEEGDDPPVRCHHCGRTDCVFIAGVQYGYELATRGKGSASG